jgi:hypothetical protein
MGKTEKSEERKRMTAYHVEHDLRRADRGQGSEERRYRRISVPQGVRSLVKDLFRRREKVEFRRDVASAKNRAVCLLAVPLRRRVERIEGGRRRDGAGIDAATSDEGAFDGGDFNEGEGRGEDCDDAHQEDANDGGEAHLELNE